MPEFAALDQGPQTQSVMRNVGKPEFVVAG
jgi:hypothetical protein